MARMHPDVEWANGMKGGHVCGVHAVRACWTRQWAAIHSHVAPHVDPHVAPREIVPLEALPGGVSRIAVRVHQTVRDLEGNLLLGTEVRRLYTLRDGLIARTDLETVP